MSGYRVAVSFLYRQLYLSPDFLYTYIILFRHMLYYLAYIMIFHPRLACITNFYNFLLINYSSDNAHSYHNLPHSNISYHKNRVLTSIADNKVFSYPLQSVLKSISTGEGKIKMEQKLRRDRNIGSNLKFLRDKHNISQEKLCALLQNRGCDIGRSTYAKYENGELNIKISVLVELRKIYNCTYDDFFEGLDIQN